MANNKTKAILLMNYLMGVVLLTAAQVIFPEKYFLDAETIKNYIPTASFQFDFLDSFNNTAFIYKWMGLGTVMPDWLAGFISYSIPFLLIILISRQQKWEFNPLTSILFSAWNILMAVYLGVYSKELISFVVIGVMTLLSKSNKGLFFGVLLAILYAVFFRIYWLLVVGFFFVNLYLLRSRKSLMTVVIVQLITAIAVFKLANLATGQFLSETRITVNLEREDGSDAATMIDNIFPNTSSLNDWMNGTFIWFSLLFPLFLLKTAEVQHVIFFGFQLVNVFLFIRAARFLKNKSQAIGGRIADSLMRQIDIMLAWCIAYSFVQGIFEPDFGSVAKHQIILVPMWFFLLNIYFKIKKESSRAGFLASPQLVPAGS